MTSYFKKKILVAIIFVFFCSCAHEQRQKRLPAEGGKKEIHWVVNPCYNIPSKPFKKYYSFAVDLEQNKIITKKSDSAPMEIRQEKPIDGQIWKDVEQFFIETGIQKSCSVVGNELTSNNSSNNSNDEDAKPLDIPFAPPLQFNKDLYYSIIDQGINSDLRSQLQNFLNSPHLQEINKPDQLVESCKGLLIAERVRCITPKTYSYFDARRKMFGGVDLKKNEDNTYSVFDYYCQKWMGPDDFKDITQDEKELPGPMNIVHSKKMNTEHTWPQSKFKGTKGSFENLIQKTDLHHIFPTDTEVNRIRGNFEFSNVQDKDAQSMKCADARLGFAVRVKGLDVPQGYYFEPPKNHKGNVARALFYFSTKYNGGMSALQEFYLRKWNSEDPVDEMEMQRNENIYKLTGVRNPFVDHPAWANSIKRFCRFRKTDDKINTNMAIDCKN